MKRIISFALCILFCMLHTVCFGEAQTVYGEIWGYRIYREGSKAGLMQGDKTAIEADYDDIIPFGVFTNETQRSEQKAFYTIQGEKKGAILLYGDSASVIPAVYDEIDYDSYDKIWVVKQDQLYGAYDQNAVLVVPVICQQKPRVFDNICILSNKAPCSYYSVTDGITYQTDWDEMYAFYEGRSLVKSGDKYGYVNKENECIIPCIYEKAYPFQQGIAFVTDDDNEPYYAIDTEGNVLFETSGFTTGFNDYGTALVLDYDSDRYGLIDINGEYLSEKDAWEMESAEFDEYGCFIATSDGEKWGIVNSRGKTVVPFICEEDYSDMLVFSEGIAAFCADEEESIYRIFSIDGEELGSFYCDFTYTPEYFSDGLLLIALSEDEFGYVDRTGNVVIPASNELDYFSSFSEGLAAVISDNGYGYIGTDGNIVIDTMYDSVSDFYNQFAVVVEDSKEKYINHAGEVIYVKP